MKTTSSKVRIKEIVVLAMMTALCFVGAAFLSIKIPIGGGNTMIHVGNAVGLLAALLMGGVRGGLAGGLGMALSDLMSPVFIIYAPFTFIQKFAMGYLCGKIAYGKKTELGEGRSLQRNFIGALVGILANIFFAQLNALIVDSLINGQNWQVVLIAGGAKLPFNLINAVIAVLVAVILYPPVSKALKLSGLWEK